MRKKRESEEEFSVVAMPEDDNVRRELDKIGVTVGGKYRVKTPIGDPVVMTVLGAKYAVRREIYLKIRSVRKK